MISVVMATYNGERFIREQLESILNQSVLPDEIIIGDDGSTDKTKEIVQEIADKAATPICFYENPQRLGYARNFKACADRAHGNLIFFSDQDDVWVRDKIKICRHILDAHPEILALSSSYQIIDENDRIKKSLQGIHRKGLEQISWKEFLRHPMYPGMAMVFRRKLWDHIPESEWGVKTAHDWIVNQNAARKNGLYKCREKLVLYRQHKGNQVGFTKDRTPDQILSQRLGLIEGMEEEISLVSGLKAGQREYQMKLLDFLRQRRKLLASGNAVKLFLLEAAKPDCITLRALMGDLYTGIKNKKRGSSWKKSAS